MGAPGHRWGHALPRRRFLETAAGGLAAAAALWPRHAALAAPADGVPRPIPGGITEFGHLFHTYPVPGSETPDFNEMSSITDFNGFLGVCRVTGDGSAITGGGPPATMTYSVDLRFMSGEFIGTDGSYHHGTFGHV